MRAAFLLRRSSPRGGEERLIAEARCLAVSVPAPVRLQVCISLDGAHAYTYGWIEPAALNGDGACNMRLSPLTYWAGVSAGEEASYHYVVATDVEPEWEEEFNRWYDLEHMPSLAAVAGTVSCARLRNLDEDGPRYHSCYDLTSARALESRAWLAARNSLSSTRVRPHFINPRRIMFRTLLDERRPIHGVCF
jgi:hypothetical protein